MTTTTTQKFSTYGIMSALTETRRLIAKELRYPEDLRKLEYLASLKKHEAKLLGYLASQEVAS